MSWKRFIAPKIAILALFSVFWLAGVERVFIGDVDHQENLHKYLQVQRKIIDNYVEPVDLTNLYKSSIRNMVRHISDSTFSVADSPLDTTFADVNIGSLRESYMAFEDAYLYLANNSEEDMNKRTEDAIDGLFSELDPHSIYIEPETSERIDEEFAGKFEGIGIQFNILDDTITVVTPISGGPSDQLGIRSGDRIVKINGESAVGFTQKEVVNNLRGPKGSEVDISIKRPKQNELLEFTIIRDEIPLYTVDTSYMLDDQTGYIKINRFAATTHEEFMKAMKELKKEGMTQLVLDLRNNPGGYLSQAIAIAEEFFSSGKVLVSTESRHSRFNSRYRSRTEGYFSDKPLMIMINEGSASASEIVSGAVQDHDRGLIVGQRSFGKGLVQQQYSLIDSSKIRVTISKYLTPSGRLIQKPYKKGREEYAYELYKRENDALSDVKEFISHVPDSLRFKTDAGRTVYGGGGIVPDHIVQEDTTQEAAVVNFMRKERVGFDFVRNYLDDNGEAFRAEWKDQFDKFRSDFTWSEQQMADLKTMMQERNLVLSDTTKKPVFRNDTLWVSETYYNNNEWMQQGMVKAELARQVWGISAFYPVFNDSFDTTLEKAMELWGEVSALQEYAMNHSKNKGGGADSSPSNWD
ncbi:MAG: S41 family peptidase [Bacteroidota bacterium]